MLLSWVSLWALGFVRVSMRPFGRARGVVGVGVV
jgi:hypothetical protein